MAYIDTDTNWDISEQAPAKWNAFFEKNPYSKYNSPDAWEAATREARRKLSDSVVREQVAQLAGPASAMIDRLLVIETGGYADDIRRIMRDARMSIVAAKQRKNPAAIALRIEQAQEHLTAWKLA